MKNFLLTCLTWLPAVILMSCAISVAWTIRDWYGSWLGYHLWLMEQIETAYSAAGG